MQNNIQLIMAICIFQVNLTSSLCTKRTQTHAHARTRVWVRLQWNRILTERSVVLPQIPHLDHSGSEKAQN